MLKLSSPYLILGLTSMYSLSSQYITQIKLKFILSDLEDLLISFLKRIFPILKKLRVIEGLAERPAWAFLATKYFTEH